MTDPISNLGRSAAQPNLANEKVKHSKTDAIPTQADKVVPPKKCLKKSTVTLCFLSLYSAASEEFYSFTHV